MRAGFCILLVAMLICSVAGHDGEQVAEGRGKAKYALLIHFLYVVATKLFVLKIVYGALFYALIVKGWHFFIWFIHFLKKKEHHHEYVEYHEPYHGHDFGQLGHDYGQTGHDYGHPGHGYGQTGHDYGQPSYGYRQPGHDYGKPSHDYGQPGYDNGHDNGPVSYESDSYGPYAYKKQDYRASVYQKAYDADGSFSIKS